MSDLPGEAVTDVRQTVPPSDGNCAEIRPRPDDAIIAPASVSTAEVGPAQRRPLIERLSAYGRHAALVACLFGLAWLAGAYVSANQPLQYIREIWPFRSAPSQESLELAEMRRMVQDMAEEIRALKADVAAMRAPQGLSAKDAAALESLTTQVSAGKAETGAAIAGLGGKIDQMERELAAKLSQIDEKFDHLERPIASSSAAPPTADEGLGRAPTRNRSRGARGDAFDPSQNPGAPGAPRPLGSLSPAAARNAY